MGFIVLLLGCGDGDWRLLGFVWVGSSGWVQCVLGAFGFVGWGVV